jgi:hypothetical protein
LEECAGCAPASNSGVHAVCGKGHLSTLGYSCMVPLWTVRAGLQFTGLTFPETVHEISLRWTSVGQDWVTVLWSDAAQGMQAQRVLV